jgi:glutamate-1-semialdehyde 2,1-aminomutase
MSELDLHRSQALFERAQLVIPGGIYGHQSPRMLVRGAQPYFFERGDGCRVWDVDGNEYIDYMCSYGPIVLGHNHPRVQEAALEQMSRGDCFNGPTPAWVELAEHLVSITPFADWAVFGKNGSDVCTWAVAVARQHTGRSRVAMAAGSYHGAHAWCTPAPGGVTKSDRANVVTFEYNDVASLRSIVDQNGDELAAIIVTPFRHEALRDQEMPADGFLPAIRDLCDRRGIVFILDDVRAGFRLHLGGSGEYFGVRPDLATYAKAIANGFPLSACVGREDLRDAATAVYFTGSYFTAAVAQAAALACLREIADSDAIARIETNGTLLRRGMEDQASRHDLPIHYTGPPAMPFLTFPQDDKFERSKLFAATCAAGGVYLAPYHNWFVSAAHTREDIEQTLDVTQLAFRRVRESFN